MTIQAAMMGVCVFLAFAVVVGAAIAGVINWIHRPRR
jgi:hypothetical protein